MTETKHCEYRRCGGLGRREVWRKWRARAEISDGTQTWKVCESCADLLTRELRSQGYQVTRKSLPLPEPTRRRRKGAPVGSVATRRSSPKEHRSRVRRRPGKRRKKPDLQFLIGEARAEGHSVLYGMRDREEWVCFIDGEATFTARTELGLGYKLADWLDARRWDE